MKSFWAKKLIVMTLVNASIAAHSEGISGSSLAVGAAAKACAVILGTPTESGPRRLDPVPTPIVREDTTEELSGNNRDVFSHQDLQDSPEIIKPEVLDKALRSFADHDDMVFTAEETAGLVEQAPSLIETSNITTEQLNQIPEGHYKSLTHINQLMPILGDKADVFLGEEVYKDGFLAIDVWLEHQPLRVMVTRLGKDRALDLLPLPVKAILALTAAK